MQLSLLIGATTNPKLMSEAVAKDVQDILAALTRAGENARRLAFQTQTNNVVMRNGKMVIEVPKASK
jgi:transaldolase